MNKRALERFAPKERVNLRNAVEKRLQRLGLDALTLPEFSTWFNQAGSTITVNGQVYLDYNKQAFQSLYQERIKVGYEQLIEELAYTWFNRLIAIRYMEVKRLLPDYVKIIEHDSLTRRPEIMDNYGHLSVNRIEIEDLKLRNEEESAYRKLFLASANKLGEVMPFLFEPLQDWTELVLPDKMLEPGGIIERILNAEGLAESFEDGVEAIGWLYQFYISEAKDAAMRLKKVPHEHLPARTQLFTPKWIVRYMIENSLGQLLLESYPDINLNTEWKYYVEPVEQSVDVQSALDQIRYKNIMLEDVSLLDPACGSGHILTYAFDLLFATYIKQGYSKRESAQLILKYNLFGMDVDRRAAQLTAFTLMMKAVEASGSSFWRSRIIPNVISIESSNELDMGYLELTFQGKDLEAIQVLLNNYEDAREYGSLLQPPFVDVARLNSLFRQSDKENEKQGSLFEPTTDGNSQLRLIWQLMTQQEYLTRQYDVVVTNPPYMSGSTMSTKLSTFANKNYSLSKADLFAMFMERNKLYTKQYGFNAMINQHSWMFLMTYEKLRIKLLRETTITSMLHLGPRAFEDIGGEVVQSTAYVLREWQGPHYRGKFYRLVDASTAVAKEMVMLKADSKLIYTPKIQDFSDIPGTPIAYWASAIEREIFLKNPSLNQVADVRQGLATADDNRFLRYWWEIDYTKIGFNMKNREEAQTSAYKWFPFNKGGSYLKWYGNLEYVINWENDGEELKRFTKSVLRNPGYHFKEGITWSLISSGKPSFRHLPAGMIASHKGPAIYLNTDKSKDLWRLLGVLNSNSVREFLKILSPTIGFEIGHIKSIPLPLDYQTSNIGELTKQNVQIAKVLWDRSETSWEFKQMALVHENYTFSKLAEADEKDNKNMNSQLLQLQDNEEKLDQMVERFYETGFYKEENLSSNTDRSNSKEKAKGLLSYFIGCLVGRYSIDHKGLIFAGGNWDMSYYDSFLPAEDGIVGLTDEHVFSDSKDIYLRLKEFLINIYGVQTLEVNLKWIAEQIGEKSKETVEQTIRNYFVKDFIKDHIQIYKKRPIYWLISSGKHKGMQALIYMHRYTPSTLGLAMQNYFVILLNQWRSLSKVTQEELDSGTLSPVAKREKTKQLKVYQQRVAELEAFQDKLDSYARQQIAIDLDDGVKVNYQKFNGILTKVDF
ncbi:MULTISPECIES: BREX-1 system adenine-specific DNA-methyltransferase PglX [Saccharibacillus]|uniref:BREX-1 system adenine-specific DNA-methyltransferase PglX n=1 Tax=Saccharibacillus TaxID=456492 RepID=UPI001239D8A1|nr:BREX-1 system adenine-specific DNA-methyltransferase PglX [Saccharibacillus sp. WB 17]MWJ31308.1 BREX-1 system adenine-specific DNA-methyltransferase PglX [Saccharibacillus sp. WB 17]